MDVQIDQAGHQRLAGDIDPESVIGFDRTIGNLTNHAAFDQHRHALGAIRGHAVEYPRILQTIIRDITFQRDITRRRSRPARPRMYECDRHISSKPKSIDRWAFYSERSPGDCSSPHLFIEGDAAIDLPRSKRQIHLGRMSQLTFQKRSERRDIVCLGCKNPGLPSQ